MSHTKFVSSFLCYAPADFPVVTVLVLVDEPRKGPSFYGGRVAAPAAAEIVRRTLGYLGVPHGLPERESRTLVLRR